MGSSRTRARTHVPCIGRRILNHCATREVPTSILDDFDHPKRNPTPLSCHPQPCIPLIGFVSLDLPILDVLYQWNRKVWTQGFLTSWHDCQCALPLLWERTSLGPSLHLVLTSRPAPSTWMSLRPSHTPLFHTQVPQLGPGCFFSSAVLAGTSQRVPPGDKLCLSAPLLVMLALNLVQGGCPGDSAVVASSSLCS